MNILINGLQAPTQEYARKPIEAFVAVSDADFNGSRMVRIGTSINNLNGEDIYLTAEDAALLAAFLFNLSEKLQSHEGKI